MAANNSPKFPRGAEWRKWDLHVHSPASHNYAGDWKGFITQIGNSDCEVIGINDYFSVEGYAELRRRLHDPSHAAELGADYQAAYGRLKAKTFFPVVECRMTNILLNKAGPGSKRLNFHIIFSDELNPDEIATFIKNLRVHDRSIGERYTNLRFLLEEAQVDFAHVRDALKGDATFEGKYRLWMPYDEHGGLDEINPETDKHLKAGLISDADFLGSSNEKQRDFFLWKNPKFSHDDYKSWFGKRKPCIKGSDCHNQNDVVGRLKDKDSRPTDRRCWIKADPTFNGLQQVINEPDERIYLGVMPPKLERVNANRMQFVSSIHIGKTKDASTPDEWFSSELPLSHDMIAIIGNKGSGKSALADIIALAGDTKRQEYFSFLQKKKFRERKLAQNFEVTATWEDGSSRSRNLQVDPEDSKPELITYIPQEYLESVCNETSVDEGSAFQKELRKVIFSHIAEPQKLGKSTLQELIDYKTEEINSELARHQQELSQINRTISALQQKATLSFAQQMQEALLLKKQELDAHEASKPQEVAQPDNLSEDQKEAYALIEHQLAEQNADIEAIEVKIHAAQQQQNVLAAQESAAGKLEARLSNLESEINAQREQGAALCSQLGLDINEILQFGINREPLKNKKAELAQRRAVNEAQLSTENSDSLIVSRKAALEKLEVLKNQLDAPSKRYQNYLQQHRGWQERKTQIEGTAEAAGSLRYIEAQLKYIETLLPSEIAAAKNVRRAAALNIHKSISNIRQTYEELFAPVQHIISQEIVIKEGFKLSFVSSIVQRGFLRDFFEGHVSQGVNGSFCGKEAGEKRLRDLIDDCDFDDPQQAIGFAEAIEDHLNFDQRTSKAAPILLASQLRKHSSPKDLYDFLWSFGYLVPEYSLKLDGKDLTQLSPGERGALLLVFYLLVDKSENPIIVDQPEENLDNQTVFHLLIPVIRKVKQSRQIIMVTHNPNIAVVCDAEQIIHASIDLQDGNRITYTSGSVEDPIMNKHILDVLEGTRPAFDNRESKYYP
jgi:energy-coupling factor transporter ATP-binding protein EcfA2